MPVTIKNIAQSLRVNPSTVSRALRSDPRVKEATRLRVARAAKEMGYRPNLAARSLVGGKTNALWLIAPDLALPYHVRLAKQASEEAARRGYDLLTAFYPEAGEARDRLLGRLVQGAADGALVIPSPAGGKSALFRDAFPDDFPLVFLDRSPTDAPDAPLVSTDQAASCRALVRSCSEAGFRFFLLLFSDDPSDSIEAARLASASAEVERLGHSFDAGKDLVRHWKTRFLSEGVALLASTQEEILSFLSENKESFRNKALSIGVFDEWRGRAAPAQRVFVCRQDSREVSRLAIEQLIGQVEKKTTPSSEVVAPKPLDILE